MQLSNMKSYPGSNVVWILYTLDRTEEDLGTHVTPQKLRITSSVFDVHRGLHLASYAFKCPAYGSARLTPDVTDSLALLCNRMHISRRKRNRTMARRAQQ